MDLILIVNVLIIRTFLRRPSYAYVLMYNRSAIPSKQSSHRHTSLFIDDIESSELVEPIESVRTSEGCDPYWCPRLPLSEARSILAMSNASMSVRGLCRQLSDPNSDACRRNSCWLPLTPSDACPPPPSQWWSLRPQSWLPPP